MFLGRYSFLFEHWGKWKMEDSFLRWGNLGGAMLGCVMLPFESFCLGFVFFAVIYFLISLDTLFISFLQNTYVKINLYWGSLDHAAFSFFFLRGFFATDHLQQVTTSRCPSCQVTTPPMSPEIRKAWMDVVEASLGKKRGKWQMFFWCFFVGNEIWEMIAKNAPDDQWWCWWIIMMIMIIIIMMMMTTTTIMTMTTIMTIDNDHDDDDTSKYSHGYRHWCKLWHTITCLRNPRKTAQNYPLLYPNSIIFFLGTFVM